MSVFIVLVFNQSIFASAKLVQLQVTTRNVTEDGTLLQDLVKMGKENFVRILLEFGFEHSLPLSLFELLQRSLQG